MQNGQFFIEFGMDRTSGKFYFESTSEKKKFIKIDNVVADSSFQVYITRDQDISKSVRVIIEHQLTSHLLEYKTITETGHAPGKMDVTFGGEISENLAVSKGFHGCIEGAFADTYESNSRKHRHMLHKFQCYNQDDYCIGKVRFNNCYKNKAYRKNTIVTVYDKVGDGGFLGSLRES